MIKPAEVPFNNILMVPNGYVAYPLIDCTFVFVFKRTRKGKGKEIPIGILNMSVPISLKRNMVILTFQSSMAVC